MNEGQFDSRPISNHYYIMHRAGSLCTARCPNGMSAALCLTNIGDVLLLKMITLGTEDLVAFMP